jgi:serine phosphatase RsbU (regulator of sigma subunit)
MFITAVIGKINIVKKEIEFVNFGHESIMVLDNENNFSYIKASHPPLGFMSLQSSSLVKTSMLDMNDKKIFIYTDGVTEGYIKDQDELTVKGLEDLILKNKSMNLQEAIHYVTNLLNNRDVLRDDITMMGLEINKEKK